MLLVYYTVFLSIINAVKDDKTSKCRLDPNRFEIKVEN